LKDAGYTCAAMSEPSANTVLAARLTKRGWVLTGIGLVVIVWAVLRVTSAAYGTSPKTNFAERQSYDMIKPRVHEAFPMAFVQGLAGVALMIAGARQRRLAEGLLEEDPA